MLGMSLNELKTKCDKIDKIEADVENVVETIKQAVTRYGVAQSSHHAKFKTKYNLF